MEKQNQKKMIHMEGGISFDLNQCKLVSGSSFNSKGEITLENLVLTPAGKFYTCQEVNPGTFTNFKEIDPRGALNWVRNQKLYPSQLPVEMVRAIEEKAGKKEEEQSNLLNRKPATASSSAGAIKPTGKKSSEKRMVYLETGKSFDLNECQMATGWNQNLSGGRDYTHKLLMTPSGTFVSCKESVIGKQDYSNFKELDRAATLNWLKNHNLTPSQLPAAMLEKLKFQQI